jgi:hypothetical protein
MNNWMPNYEKLQNSVGARRVAELLPLPTATGPDCLPKGDRYQRDSQVSASRRPADVPQDFFPGLWR